MIMVPGNLPKTFDAFFVDKDMFFHFVHHFSVSLVFRFCVFFTRRSIAKMIIIAAALLICKQGKNNNFLFRFSMSLPYMRA